MQIPLMSGHKGQQGRSAGPAPYTTRSDSNLFVSRKTSLDTHHKQAAGKVGVKPGQAHRHGRYIDDSKRYVTSTTSTTLQTRRRRLVVALAEQVERGGRAQGQAVGQGDVHVQLALRAGHEAVAPRLQRAR